MRLQSTITGVVVEAEGEQAERLLAYGYTKAKPKRTSKRKTELVDEAAHEMTNAELAEAIDAAKKSPAKPRAGKKAE